MVEVPRGEKEGYEPGVAHEAEHELEQLIRKALQVRKRNVRVLRRWEPSAV